MYKLIILIIIALVANISTVFLYNDITNHPVGGEGAWTFIFGAFAIWTITPLLTIIIAIVYRKIIFKKAMLKWSIPVMLFCTPAPAWAIDMLIHPTPKMSVSSESYNPKNGKVYKTESWDYTSTYKRYVTKHFVADSAQEDLYGDAAYKKDSIWIYLSKTGDTLKVEHYKNDRLIWTE